MAKAKKAVTPISVKIWLTEQLSDKGLRHSIIGAFIGGFLAIFAGLMVYSIQTYNQHVHEVRIKNEEKRILLEGFKRSLQDNIKIMDGLVDFKNHAAMNPLIVVNNLNLNYFQSTSQIKYETLENIKLAEEIDDLTFRMNSLEQAIKNLQGIYFNPLSSVDKNFLKTKGRELQMFISVGTGETLVAANTVLKDVLTELVKLDEKLGTPHEP